MTTRIRQSLATRRGPGGRTLELGSRSGGVGGVEGGLKGTQCTFTEGFSRTFTPIFTPLFTPTKNGKNGWDGRVMYEYSVSHLNLTFTPKFHT